LRAFNQQAGSIYNAGEITVHVKFPVTIHLFLFRSDQILLLHRFQTGYMDGRYSVPAGHLEGEEMVRMAGVREAREEIGVLIDPQDMLFAGVFHRHSDDERVDFFFQVQKWEGEPVNAEPGKCDELRWAGINNLPENTVPYVRRAIENLQSGILFQEFGWM
jgi:8-oxo-dGTP pyrophosphatase MutT (NUDIX family)